MRNASLLLLLVTGCHAGNVAGPKVASAAGSPSTHQATGSSGPITVQRGAEVMQLNDRDLAQLRDALVQSIRAAELHEDDRAKLLQRMDTIEATHDSVRIGDWVLESEDESLVFRTVPWSGAHNRTICRVPVSGAPGAFTAGRLDVTHAHLRPPR